MNCKQIEELLPLYVGRDLEEKHTKLVTEHVQSCAECASSADEYRETRQLLQQFAPPPFGDAVYARIRKHVLSEIGRESTEQTLPRLVTSLLRPRITWAFATALLFAVCAFAFYFSINRRSDRQQVDNNPRTLDRAAQPSARSKEPGSTVSSSASKKSDRPGFMSTWAKRGQNITGSPALAVSTDRLPQSQRPKSRVAGVDRSWSNAGDKPGTRSMAVEASLKDNTLADLDVVASRDPSSSQKTLRMEIQTKDRNIRIIWFSHQPTKQGSASESSKGI